MSDGDITVVTPSYEQADYLGDNLQSVMNQSGMPVEHIVIDGGSTDETVEILESYEDQYNLKWISEPDNGQSEAINKGIEMATGEWIYWVNSDDYLLDGAISRFAEHITAHPSSDVIYGDFFFVDADGNEVGRKYNTNPSEFVHKHYYQFTGNHCTLIRQSVFEEVGMLNEDLDYTMDTEFFWRILRADLELVRINEFFGARRLHEGAKTTGEPSGERQAEIKGLRNSYPASPIETILPQKLLTAIAFSLQALYHVSNGRPNAVRHMNL
ncbi:glycosyltransferase family 2 protein [Haloarcula argentinensis]|nr:glycosyltransferase family 2 protein [Haloarcula argentinensis]